jgi:hypothetical protein
MTRPTTGKLVFINNATKRTVVIREGQFSLLNHIKKSLKKDPQYHKGKLKLTY